MTFYKYRVKGSLRLPNGGVHTWNTSTFTSRKMAMDHVRVMNTNLRSYVRVLGGQRDIFRDYEKYRKLETLMLEKDNNFVALNSLPIYYLDEK